MSITDNTLMQTPSPRENIHVQIWKGSYIKHKAGFHIRPHSAISKL